MSIIKPDINNIYYNTKRDLFYYLEVVDKQHQRDNQLSSLFDEPEERFYIGANTLSIGNTLTSMNDLKYSRFFKDKKAAEDAKRKYSQISKLNTQEIDADTFINIIPDKYDIENFITRRNIKLKTTMSKSMSLWIEHRQKYKGISAYKRTNSKFWLPCSDCSLIPLIWEFNNGRSTACGCGKDEYVHHSIHAESIMSYVKRNKGSAAGYDSDELRINWNKWVVQRQDVFKQQKEANPDIW